MAMCRRGNKEREVEGRQVQHDGVKQHAERIFLEINRHPLHNADAPLYFAKMLYMHFVMGEPIDFG